MIWLLYNILFVIGFLVMLPHFLLRMKRRGGYLHDFSHRFGSYRPELRAKLREGPRIWVHAVSVGELFVAMKFMEELRKRRPGARFVLSTTTSTGHAIADRQLQADDVLIYFPIDFPAIVRRALNAIRPQALVLVECELWPNLIRLAKRRGIPVVLVNGRISEHSYRGYRMLRIFTRPLLSEVDLFCVQSEADRERLVDLGAAASRIHVVGTAKYDLASGDGGGAEKAWAVLGKAGIGRDDLVLLGGSTWAGEEAALLDAYRGLKERFPRLALVLVPRHAERSGDVVKDIEAAGLRWVRRTALEAGPQERPDVLLVDTTGELKMFYAAASIIFVGKSLTQHGGQNIIEPAQFGKPILVGPNMENFAAVMDDFRSAGAIVEVKDAKGLLQAIEQLLADEARRALYGRHAAEVVRDNAGAIAKTLDLCGPSFPGVG